MRSSEPDIGSPILDNQDCGARNFESTEQGRIARLLRDCIPASGELPRTCARVRP